MLRRKKVHSFDASEIVRGHISLCTFCAIGRTGRRKVARPFEFQWNLPVYRIYLPSITLRATNIRSSASLITTERLFNLSYLK